MKNIITTVGNSMHNIMPSKIISQKPATTISCTYTTLISLSLRSKYFADFRFENLIISLIYM